MFHEDSESGVKMYLVTTVARGSGGGEMRLSLRIFILLLPCTLHFGSDTVPFMKLQLAPVEKRTEETKEPAFVVAVLQPPGFWAHVLHDQFFG